MRKEEYLSLLIAEKNQPDAELLAKILGDAGHSISFDYVADEAAFEAALAEQIPDIVLCANDAEDISPKFITRILQEGKLSVPVIVITDEPTGVLSNTDRQSGIAALVCPDQPEHLLLEVAREKTLLQLRHKLAALEVAIEKSENRCSALVDHSSEAIAIIDADYNWHPNQSCIERFGFSNCEEAEKVPLLELISEKDRDTFEAFLHGYTDDGSQDNFLEITCAAHDGSRLESIVEFTPASVDGASCTQILIRSSQSECPDKDVKPAVAANLDTLTRLSNRQHFMGLLKENIDQSAAGDGVCALIYLTLDGFKELREENGIAASDKVLCNVARLLESRCNSRDRIARFGDYSYTILYHAESNEKVQSQGEKLLQDIPAQLLEIYGSSLSMTCSIGVCAITGCATEAEKILSHADTACEVARSSGGNNIHTHSAVIDEQMSEGHEKERDEAIIKTVEEKRFYLAYQPIISLTGAAGKRYEALLRIVDEEGHSILPGQFLELAEKAGLSSEIDYWIFETAFAKIAELRDNDDDITVFLKLSRTTLADAQLPAWIDGKLKEFGLSSASVVFQIQELDSIKDLKSAISFVKAMKKIKCKVALEHFGINNQPQLLKHVPADILKIDGSLTENLAGNKDKQSRIREIIRVAHKLDVQCIAERVDNPGSLAILWQNEVDMIQGNFVQEPDRELSYDFEGEIA